MFVASCFFEVCHGAVNLVGLYVVKQAWTTVIKTTIQARKFLNIVIWANHLGVKAIYLYRMLVACGSTVESRYQLPLFRDWQNSWCCFFQRVMVRSSTSKKILPAHPSSPDATVLALSSRYSTVFLNHLVSHDDRWEHSRHVGLMRGSGHVSDCKGDYVCVKG